MMIASAYVDLLLYLDGQPMWLEHSTRSAVDVVAIPLKLDQFDGFANTRINMVEQENRLEPRAGMDCFVLGFPEGIIGAALTPIWKRGSIASEPYLQTPYLIDAATRKGMSGAPVIVRHNGIFGITGEVMTGAEIIGTVERFVAIYSSRIGDDAIGFPIGTAWRAAVLDDILSFELAGEHPYPFA